MSESNAERHEKYFKKRAIAKEQEKRERDDF